MHRMHKHTQIFFNIYLLVSLLYFTSSIIRTVLVSIVNTVEVSIILIYWAESSYAFIYSKDDRHIE